MGGGGIAEASSLGLDVEAMIKSETGHLFDRHTDPFTFRS
jgi:hypothetical protein